MDLEEMKKYYIGRIGEIVERNEDDRAELARTVQSMSESLNATVAQLNEKTEELNNARAEIEEVRKALEEMRTAWAEGEEPTDEERDRSANLKEW